MNSKDPPPGSNDPAGSRAAPATPQPERTIVELSGPPPLAPQAKTNAPGASNGPSSPPAAGNSSLQQGAADRRDPSPERHRIAAGLPPQPPPAGARTANRVDQPSPGTAKGMATLSPTAASLLRASSNPSTTPSAGSATGSNRPPMPTGAQTRTDLPMPERKGSAKLGAAASPPNMPASGRSQPASAARAMLGASEPEPPISGRPEGVAGLLAGSSLSTSPISAASLLDQKRIAPRSPRAALEPDHVPVPTRSSRPSRRARNPLVIVGNAIFTLLVLLLIVGGGTAVIGKTRFEAPGPLTEDKVVTIPPRSGMMDIADLLKREGVIDEHRLIFMGGVIALKAKSDLKAGEYVFPKRASVRDVVEIIVEGKVVQHQITIPEGLTSEQIVARLLENEMLSGSIKDVPREGSLLPDGYHINRGFTREQMLQRMRQAQDRLVREVWERRNPDLPLRSAREMRNVLSHGYFGVDLAVVWTTIQANLPPLKQQLRRALAAFEGT